MTSYFDDFDRQVAEYAQVDDDDAFLEALAGLEDTLVHEVSLVTGDREFPDDLRQRVQGIIAVQWTGGPAPSERAREYAAAGRTSWLSTDLHEAFHDLARRRVSTRFGVLGDSPSQILLLREEHDG